MPGRSSSNHQLELIRRYARILRQEAAQYRGPRIGSRERRLAQKATETALAGAETAARAALGAVRPGKSGE